ncbi:MAG: ABC transporter ATP-binding protein [Candidatus Eisenbacteria bacterium]|uniref:ABC transporter ATP-binding protein n=1 Tax=Eiseniibacteriota bacterium TaxID=2212470 RepID=A0A538SY18_UNCEI|nr:MAG: ABC transporter ATP-binding protein [Candidatus Eisenbacteria bacterium]TMQ56287.1 MAG: ABC transporter ATP-binding protein [Candidatus Eisenbacteria bacterium]
MSLLSLADLHVHYGAIHALKGVSIAVDEGTIVTLVGANGAGKSTTLRAISGLIPASGGDIRFRGKSLLGMKAHEIVRAGISHVPEGRIVFANLTVLENLDLGAYLRRDRAGIAEDMKKIFRLFPRLEERRRQAAGTLSGGEQQMLAIGRALMARPTVLLMDEPSLGLAPILVREIFSVIREIRAAGTTIVLVEQNARMALATADQGYVLETGSVRMSDRASVLLESPFVQAAYLGGAG